MHSEMINNIKIAILSLYILATLSALISIPIYICNPGFENIFYIICCTWLGSAVFAFPIIFYPILEGRV